MARGTLPSIISGIKGVLRVREHCTFEWWQALPDGRAPVAWSPRRLRIEEHHCASCVAQVRHIAEHEGYEIADRRPPAEGWPEAPTQPWLPAHGAK